MTHRSTFMIVVTALASLAGLMQSPAATAERTIVACVSPAGHLRLIGPGGRCHHDERLVTWNVTGPAGPTGEPAGARLGTYLGGNGVLPWVTDTTLPTQTLFATVNAPAQFSTLLLGQPIIPGAPTPNVCTGQTTTITQEMAPLRAINLSRLIPPFRVEM